MSVQEPKADVRIGRGTYGTPKVLWGGQAKLRIGAFCSVSQGVTVFLGGEHRTDWVTTWPFWEKMPAAVPSCRSTKGDVVIGNDVWLGMAVVILSGVTIGHGAVVGAMAVVATDVPPYAIVAGNPARLIRYRFDPQTIARLLKVAWWDWSDERLVKAAPLMSSDKIENFLKYAEGKAV